MGSLFKSSSAKQSTTQQSVGVQGTGATGQSGTIGGSQVNSGFGARDIVAGGSVNIISSDIAALESNQAISMAAINASAQTSIGALSVLQSTQQNAAALIAEVQAGANHVALKATPVSAGDVATATLASMKPVLTVLIVGAVVIGAVLIFNKLK